MNGQDSSMAPGALGPYRISRQIGAGGMGVVYEAWDDRLQRAVALKILNKATLDAEAEKRIWREGRVAAAINHPNMGQLYDIGEDRGHVFLVMELLIGESLAEKISRGPIDLPDAIQVALGILTSLGVVQILGSV